ncbi:MAG: GNAT family N-acetyltransferase [Candidatus Eremiobacterota bacterium]
MNVEVREADEQDLAWVVALAEQCVVFGIPAGRPLSDGEVRENARRNLATLPAAALENPAVKVLVAFDAETGERLGYLILTLDERDALTGTPQSFIYDLAVDPRHWGRYVVHRLVRRAAQVTAEHGLSFMVGEVTVDNERTLVQARRLGFQVESYRMAGACGPEGLGPLPGRGAESAYERSRRRGGRTS